MSNLFFILLFPILIEATKNNLYFLQSIANNSSTIKEGSKVNEREILSSQDCSIDSYIDLAVDEYLILIKVNGVQIDLSNMKGIPSRNETAEITTKLFAGDFIEIHASNSLGGPAGIKATIWYFNSKGEMVGAKTDANWDCNKNKAIELTNNEKIDNLKYQNSIYSPYIYNTSKTIWSSSRNYNTACTYILPNLSNGILIRESSNGVERKKLKRTSCKKFGYIDIVDSISSISINENDLSINRFLKFLDYANFIEIQVYFKYNDEVKIKFFYENILSSGIIGTIWYYNSKGNIVSINTNNLWTCDNIKAKESNIEESSTIWLTSNSEFVLKTAKIINGINNLIDIHICSIKLPDNINNICEFGYYSKNPECENCKVNCNSCITNCIKCPENCSSCESKDKCTSCIGNLEITSDSKCLPPCNINQYRNEQQICTPCPENCESCINNYNCRTCKNGYTLDNTNKCNLKCSSQQFISNDKCEYCKDNCETCTSSDKCTSCKKGFNLISGICKDTCLEGQFRKNNICTNCHSQCLTCYYETEQTCSSCSGNLILYDSTCLSECPIGTVKVIVNNKFICLELLNCGVGLKRLFLLIIFLLVLF